VRDVNNPPKAADFKGWTNIFADPLSQAGRLRSYLKAIVDKTRDLTGWLQRNSNATPVDADIVIEATGQLIGTVAVHISRHEHGEPDRCPRCESYRMRQDIETDEKQIGFRESEICASCGWQSEPEFTSFHDHIARIRTAPRRWRIRRSWPMSLPRVRG
jgi:hypothetical protein